MNATDLSLVQRMLRYSQLPEFQNADPKLWDMESPEDSILVCGFTIFDGPEGFEVSVEYTQSSGSHWEPDFSDYMMLGTFKTLGDAVMHIITDSVISKVTAGLDSDAEAEFCREQEMFWAQQDKYLSELRG